MDDDRFNHGGRYMTSDAQQISVDLCLENIWLVLLGEAVCL